MSLRHIQEFLGHSSSKTTEIYRMSQNQIKKNTTSVEYIKYLIDMFSFFTYFIFILQNTFISLTFRNRYRKCKRRNTLTLPIK
jgi:hypothetical protein